jgi:RHS repeat-associated protein
LTSRSDYDAFGLQTGGSSANSIGYTGQRLDNETGLMALGNGERYYSPSYARFIQQDSFSGNGSMPQSLNRFAYGYNNPNKYRDLNGNNPEGEKDETAEWLRETRKAVSNHSSGSWWTDFHSNMSLGIMEVGYGGYKFGKDFVTQPIYGEIDKVKDAYYNAVGADYNDRSYLSSTYQSEQSKIVGGMSVNQAKWETTKAQVYSAATFGLGPLVESTGSNIYALIDGRMDITDYNIGQGKNLTEAVAMYAMAKGTRLAMESSGAAKPMTFRESLGNLKSDAISLRNSGSRAISSIKETVGKVNANERGSLTLKGAKYNTTPLLTKFAGEETGKVFGSKVNYLSEAERSSYKLTVKDGKVFDSRGNLFDTTSSSSLHSGGGKAIFVMDEAGSIYASPTQTLGKFHHSSFLSGKAVASAGELKAVNGVIQEVSRKSGHYQPSVKINSQIMTELKNKGVDVTNIQETKGF